MGEWMPYTDKFIAALSEVYGNHWQPASVEPFDPGPYLVFMPDRELDQYSVQHWDAVDGWSNNFGITHWLGLPSPPKTAREQHSGKVLRRENTPSASG